MKHLHSVQIIQLSRKKQNVVGILQWSRLLLSTFDYFACIQISAEQQDMNEQACWQPHAVD